MLNGDVWLNRTTGTMLALTIMLFVIATAYSLAGWCADLVFIAVGILAIAESTVLHKWIHRGKKKTPDIRALQEPSFLRWRRSCRAAMRESLLRRLIWFLMGVLILAFGIRAACTH